MPNLKQTPAQKLAAAILRLDEDCPGDPDADFEVPAEVWAEWIDLAGAIEREGDES